mgnify:CR=1 FL=1
MMGDLAKINLIYMQNKQNLKDAIQNLIDIDAIDKINFEITDLGNELLRFNFIPIQYVNAVVNYSKRFNDLKDKRDTYFFAPNKLKNLANLLIP